MQLWCCIEPEREEKTSRIMNALAEGCQGRAILGEPPDDGSMFAIWGHKFMSEKLVPQAVLEKRPFWFIDNGYWKPARGTKEGYHSVSFCGLRPIELVSPQMNRNDIELKPWNKDRGGHVLIALPGMAYGGMLGFNMEEWSKSIKARVSKYTDRKILIRPKRFDIPLENDLEGVAVLITHSSKVAIDAIIQGIPCIVEPTNPAAPVCSTSLEDIESPRMPDRRLWWQSLMCQQFSVAEMRSGIASHWMKKVEEQYVGTVHR